MARIRFRANHKQLKLIMANAVNASKPPPGPAAFLAQMNFLAAGGTQKSFPPETFNIQGDHLGHIHLDYVGGRMVKLRIFKMEQTGAHMNAYEMDENLREDYQSWIEKYPTVHDLLASVGVKADENREKSEKDGDDSLEPSDRW